MANVCVKTEEGIDTKVATSEPLEFAVYVDRSSGSALGIDIESGKDSRGWDGRTLLVKQVHEAGLFGAWAVSNPAAAVLPGDRIVAVNGHRGNAEQLIEECRRHQPLDVLVARELLLPECMPAQANVSADVQPRARRIPEGTLAAIREEIAGARSATAAVQIVRRQFERNWDFAWGAEALACIAKRSTAQTRQGWSEDPSVTSLAQRLRAEATASRARDATEIVLVALDALRRMGLQGPEEQRQALQAAAAQFAAEQWRQPVTSVTCLLQLAAPLQLDGLGPAQLELRRRFQELAGPDVAALAAAMRRSAVALLLRGPRELKRGTVVCSGFDAAPELTLSFDLLPRGEVAGWANILRFTSADQEGIEPGDRSSLPALYFAPKTTRLCVAAAQPEAETAEERISAEGLPAGQMSRVTLRLSGKLCEVLVNGREVCSMPGCGGQLPMPKPGERVRIWGSGGEHAAASALVSNLTYRPTLHCPGRDAELLERLLRRLRTEGLLSDLTAPELAELAEGLAELGAPLDKAAFKAFGQEVLQRRPEFTPEELWRVQVSFSLCGMPLNQVWAAVGASNKHSGGKIFTKQAFAPQRNHAKRQKTEHEVERASPPRSFADRVRSSF